MLWLKILSQLNLGIVIIISGGIAGVYYLWKYDNGQAIKDETQSLEKQKAAVQEKIEVVDFELKQLQEMDKAIRLMGNEINKFLQFIPNKLTSSMILNHLNIHAKSAGVDMQNIQNHSTVEDHEFYEKIKISVTVTGLFSQVLVFLSKLTGLTEIITIGRFNLSEVRQRRYVGGLNEIKMEMDIYGYRYTSPIISEKIENTGESGGVEQ
ncbi:MAG: type 4a pilus biogenesis protein PilO [Bdellovibrionales bacterium]|nr:type 4a pilus biogenesis protein PilO [Bdellovibrionales bacterium]